MLSIFYVEDEPFLAKIVKETLETNGYKVTLVSDGGAAEEIYSSDTFHVCILDIMLPNKSGYEIAKSIRKRDATIPILFLTAKDQTSDLLKGFEVGGNDYIRKPFSMEELMVRIQNLVKMVELQPTDMSSGEIYIGKQFSFYPSRLSLDHNGVSKTLSHRESQILQLMCSNINQVTERKDILIGVWGDDSFYNSRNLDVYITKLRGYFKADPKIKITTLKGVGYQFVVSE